MTIYDCILLSMALIIIVPILTYLAVKSGTVGFYRGREINNKRKEEEESESEILDNDSVK